MLPIEKDKLAPGETPKPNKVEPARKTWFFQKPNGEIFSCHQNEAWQLLQKTSVYQRDLKMIGCSDGMIFQKAVHDAHKVFQETKDLEKAQEILRAGELAEIEAARGNLERPQDPSRVTFAKT